MGRAKGQHSAVTLTPSLRSVAETDAFGAVFGSDRGSSAGHRCVSCGARAGLNAHADGRLLCELCARAAALAAAEAELDVTLNAISDQLTVDLKGADLETEVAARDAACALIQAEIDRLRSITAASASKEEYDRARQLGEQAKARYDSIKVLVALPQKEENKLIRRDLKRAFPDTKFRVTHGGVYGVTVEWTDGPAPAEVVEQVTGNYTSEHRHLDPYGEPDTSYVNQYVRGLDGRPVRVSSGSTPESSRRLSPEWNAELRAEFAHLMNDPSLLDVADGVQHDVSVDKGMIYPTSGLEDYRKPHVSQVLMQTAKFRSRDKSGKVLMAGGSGYDGMTPWEARNAQRQADWQLPPEPEPDFTASPPPPPAPRAAAAGDSEPLSTVASLKRRLEVGVELTCVANVPYRQAEVGKTRTVARLQGNLAKLARQDGERRSEEFYFPKKSELRVTGPDSFDVLSSDGSLEASYIVGAKPKSADTTAPRFERAAYKARVTKNGELSIPAPFYHGGRHAGTVHVTIEDGAYGQLTPRVSVDTGSFSGGRHGKVGFAKLALSCDGDGRATIDWDNSRYQMDRPSDALRAHAESVLSEVDSWLDAQRKTKRPLAELKAANAK